MKTISIVRIEEDFLSSGGNLKLTFEEFTKYFGLSIRKSKKLYEQLKTFPQYIVKKEFDNSLKEVIARLTIDPAYAWIKNNVIKEEQPLLISIAEKTKMKIRPDYIKIQNKHIVGLDLSGSGLGKIGLPEELLQLKYLPYLNLKANGLQFFPEEVTNISTLSEINIANNFIKELSPSIANLSRLKRINIGRNEINNISALLGQISGLELIQFGDRDYLKEILNQLSENKTFLEKNDQYFTKHPDLLQQYLQFLKYYVWDNLTVILGRFPYNNFNFATDDDRFILMIGVLLEADKKITGNLTKREKMNQPFLDLKTLANVTCIHTKKIESILFWERLELKDWIILETLYSADNRSKPLPVSDLLKMYNIRQNAGKLSDILELIEKLESYQIIVVQKDGGEIKIRLTEIGIDVIEKKRSYSLNYAEQTKELQSYWEELNKADPKFSIKNIQDSDDVIKAFRQWALRSRDGVIALAKGFKSLYMNSGEIPHGFENDKELLQAIEKANSLPNDDIQWLLNGHY